MNAYPPLPVNTGTPVSAPPFVVEHLARTCGWARVVSVLWLLLLIISMALVIFSGNGVLALFSSSSPVESLGFLIKLVFSVLAFIRLGMYASAIKRLMFNRRPQDLVDAMLQQKIFWKSTGILMIMYLLQFGYTIATSGFGMEGFGRI